MKNIKLNKQEKSALDEFKSKLLERFKKSIVLIEMFGSKARGNAHKNSDIDVLVVYKGNGQIKESLLAIEWKIFKKYDYDVALSMMPYTLKEYRYDSKIKTPFLYNVEKDGVVLWNTLPTKRS
jgi:predicted nucleotidyltransferase